MNFLFEPWKEYASIFPNIDKTAKFNSSVIRALKDIFTGDIDFYLSSKIGEDAYNNLFKQSDFSTSYQGKTYKFDNQDKLDKFKKQFNIK